MQEHSILRRLEILEQTVGALEILPARVSAVESQILHLREEMRDGVSALGAELRAEMEALEQRLTVRIVDGDDETQRQMQMLEQTLVARIAEGDEETRRYMRVLHEEVLARISTIQEGFAK